MMKNQEAFNAESLRRRPKIRSLIILTKDPKKKAFGQEVISEGSGRLYRSLKDQKAFVVVLKPQEILVAELKSQGICIKKLRPKRIAVEELRDQRGSD